MKYHLNQTKIVIDYRFRNWGADMSTPRRRSLLYGRSASFWDRLLLRAKPYRWVNNVTSRALIAVGFQTHTQMTNLMSVIARGALITFAALGLGIPAESPYSRSFLHVF